MTDRTDPRSDAAPTDAPETGVDRGGALLVLTWLGLSAVALVVFQVALGLTLVGVELGLPVLQGAELRPTLKAVVERLSAGELPSWFFALAMTGQFPLMLATMPATVWVVDRLWYRRHGGAPEVSREVLYGLKPVAVAFFIAAGIMGFVTGWLPGWIADWVRTTMGLDSLSITMITNALTEGPLFFRGTAIFWVALGAPFVEEIVFRGFLWHALERARAPGWMAWLGTSMIFAGYHMDPAQSTGLIFTALALGWLRWRSGSIWPGVLMHIVNNSLGVLGAVAGLADTDLPLSIAISGALLSLALWGVVDWIARREAEAGATA